MDIAEQKQDHQTEQQCLRQNDHESHTWFGMKDRWCPGVIAQPLDMKQEPVMAGGVQWQQCDRITAHGEHRITVKGNVWCHGVKAHHLCQIGKGGPHDPDKRA